MSFERANIHAMDGYLPGEQPNQPDVIKLNTNENPYPAPAAVAAALAAIRVEDLRRYPPPTATAFRQTAAQLHGVAPECILPTNGGDELLRLAVTTFCGTGDTLGIAMPSYSLYPVLANIQGCRVAAIPMTDDWRLRDDFPDRLNAAGARLAMVVNPHAPSGKLTSAVTLKSMARRFRGVLLVDEAYVDFVDPELRYDLVATLRSCPNLLILRTLSKGYSLAGLRFGYGIGNPDLIEPMISKTRDSYNTDYISQQLATAALKAAKDASKTWEQVRTERARLSAALQTLGLSCLPSQANFVLAQVPAQASAEALYQSLKADGILIRYFDQDRLRDKLRITVGTPSQNDRLLDRLQAHLGA